MKTVTDFKQQMKSTVGAPKDIQPSDRPFEGGDSRDEIAIPNFFVDGLSRRPGRVGKLRLRAVHAPSKDMTRVSRAGRMVSTLRKELEAQGEPLSWIQLINQCMLNMDALERDLKDVGKQLR
jgi:hypothetical protein